jgi:hypothetical protein
MKLVCASCRRPATDAAICECGLSDYVEETTGDEMPGAPAAGGVSDDRPPVRHMECVFTESGKSVPLAPGTCSMLGRDPSMSEVAPLLQDDFVSRRHATIGIESDGRPWIRDEYSTNGTYVNNEKVPPGASRSLRHNDRIRIGEVNLKIRRVAPPGQENGRGTIT